MSASQRQRRREVITKAVLQELGVSNSEMVARAHKTWWSNIRRSGGFRLTAAGDQAFQQADIQCFSYELDLTKQDLSGVGGAVQLMLELDRLVDVPYSFHRQRGTATVVYLRIYDSRVAMMIDLYGGIVDYVQAVKSNHSS